MIPQDTETVVPVKVETSRTVTIVSEKTYNGYLQPRAEVKVFANISGKIVKINAIPGKPL